MPCCGGFSRQPSSLWVDKRLLTRSIKESFLVLSRRSPADLIGFSALSFERTLADLAHDLRSRGQLFRRTAIHRQCGDYPPKVLHLCWSNDVGYGHPRRVQLDQGLEGFDSGTAV